MSREAAVGEAAFSAAVAVEPSLPTLPRSFVAAASLAAATACLAAPRLKAEHGTAAPAAVKIGAAAAILQAVELFCFPLFAKVPVATRKRRSLRTGEKCGRVTHRGKENLDPRPKLYQRKPNKVCFLLFLQPSSRGRREQPCPAPLGPQRRRRSRGEKRESRRRVRRRRRRRRGRRGRKTCCCCRACCR